MQPPDNILEPVEVDPQEAPELGDHSRTTQNSAMNGCPRVTSSGRVIQEPLRYRQILIIRPSRKGSDVKLT